MKYFNIITKNYLLITFLVGLSALLGSLYFSEVEGMVPCVLCWYQRILFYPLAIVSGAALVFNEKFSEKLVLALTIPGILLSTYHYLLQKTDIFEGSAICGGTSIACSTEYINWFGFVTIPFLSLLAFSFVSAICIAKVVFAKRK